MDNIFITGWAKIGKACGGAHASTVKRWHKKNGMPVHRLPHNIPAVIPAQVEVWLQSYSTRFKELMDKKEEDEKTSPTDEAG